MPRRSRARSHIENSPLFAYAVPFLVGNRYQIIDRIGIRVLRDPYTNKPYVQFYTTKRVGGGLLNPEPLRGLKVSA